MAFSIRLDAATERAITRLAKQRGQTKASVVREALAAYEASAKSPAGPESAAVRLAPFIGIADSGGSRRAENTGNAFRALLDKSGRQRGRRPR